MDGVVRIQVRAYGWAGDELMVELDSQTPNVIGLPVTLEARDLTLHAVVKEEREQDGRSLLICELQAHYAGERGAFG